MQNFKGVSLVELHLTQAVQAGLNSIHIYVGRWTGHSPCVLGALRRRGYRVQSEPNGGYSIYAKTS